MKPGYKLDHLRHIASFLPKIKVGLKKVMKKKKGSHLSRQEIRDFNIEKVIKNKWYPYSQVEAVYMDHMSNLKKLNKRADYKEAIEHYCSEVKAREQKTITSKLIIHEK